MTRARGVAGELLILLRDYQAIVGVPTSVEKGVVLASIRLFVDVCERCNRLSGGKSFCLSVCPSISSSPDLTLSFIYICGCGGFH